MQQGSNQTPLDESKVLIIEEVLRGPLVDGHNQVARTRTSGGGIQRQIKSVPAADEREDEQRQSGDRLPEEAIDGQSPSPQTHVAIYPAGRVTPAALRLKTRSPSGTAPPPPACVFRFN